MRLKAALQTHQTPLRCIAPTFTTMRSFSFLRMPSRLPRDMPQTLRSLVPLIMLLSVSVRGSEAKSALLRRNAKRAYSPCRRATQTPFASTWKQRVPSSSQRVVVTR